MSLGTSMMTNPLMMYAMQRTIGFTGSCYARRTGIPETAWENSGINTRHKDSMNFGCILSGKTTENVAMIKETDVSTDCETDCVSKIEMYTDYLKSKYGNLMIKNVGKDQKTLDQLGKSMSGSDVIIAPNIVEQMTNDPEKAVYYERKIDAFFEDIPRQTTIFAAKGLDYQPCGVVVHEDGSVTYISGCADSPERVAQVNAINKVKREKQAAERKAALERSQEAARTRQELMERYNSRFWKGQ